MTSPKYTAHKITRRTALMAAIGLSAAPTLAAARGGPDPWKPKRKDKGQISQSREKLGGPRMR